jgi:poly-beta-1,6-N-acetyl-D-glucosamine synthase
MIWVFFISLLPYLVLLLILSAYLAMIKPYVPGTLERETYISVIIPCRNEAVNLPALLGDLSRQDYPSEYYEVIVVDDHSVDGTGNVTSSFSGIINLKLINSAGHGKKKAIRTGVGISAGELVITTDADCRAGSRWLSTVAACYSDEKPDMIICPVSINEGKGFIINFGAMEFLALQGITAASAFSGNPVMCNGANLAFTRKAFRENEAGLHEGLESGDDMFLLQAMKKNKKYKITWLESEDAVIKTSSPGSAGALILQRSRWLSKAGSYTDPWAIIAGIVTFVTIAGILTLLASVFFNPGNLLLFAGSLVIKSIPDLIITGITAARRSRLQILRWFVPVQLAYPFYVIVVLAYSLSGKVRWK